MCLCIDPPFNDAYFLNVLLIEITQQFWSCVSWCYSVFSFYKSVDKGKISVLCFVIPLSLTISDLDLNSFLQNLFELSKRGNKIVLSRCGSIDCNALLLYYKCIYKVVNYLCWKISQLRIRAFFLCEKIKNTFDWNLSLKMYPVTWN